MLHTNGVHFKGSIGGYHFEPVQTSSRISMEASRPLVVGCRVVDQHRQLASLCGGSIDKPLQGWLMPWPLLVLTNETLASAWTLLLIQ